MPQNASPQSGLQSDQQLAGWQYAMFRSGFVPVAWIVWGIFAVVIAIVNGINPNKSSVSIVYRAACSAWWGGREMYDDYYNGFIYLPHAALVYTPFYLLPARLGEPLYRIVIIALLAWSVWRLTLLTKARAWNENFLVVSLLVIAVGAGSGINGQYNLPLTATLIFATCTIIEKKWWAAAIWLVVSILLKPIAIAPVLLALALYPPLWWRIPLVGLIVGFVPFLFSPTDLGYAAAEYKTFWDTVVRATLPLERRFAEFSTILYWFGYDLNNAQRQIVRAIAAVGTLALCWVALRRHGPFQGSLLVWALGVTYLMIFNPRTEGVTYVIVAPALTIFGALEFAGPGKPAWRRGVGLVFLIGAILMSVAHELMPRGGEYQRMAQGRKDLLMRPMICVAFYVWLMWRTLWERPAAEVLPEKSPPASVNPL